jgi:hypothetical protein
MIASAASQRLPPQDGISPTRSPLSWLSGGFTNPLAPREHWENLMGAPLRTAFSLGRRQLRQCPLVLDQPY